MWELGEGGFWGEGNWALEDDGGTLEEGNGALESGSGALEDSGGALEEGDGALGDCSWALEDGDGALGDDSGVLDDCMVGGGEALVRDGALLGMLGPHGVLEGMADYGDLQAGILDLVWA